MSSSRAKGLKQPGCEADHSQADKKGQDEGCCTSTSQYALLASIVTKVPLPLLYTEIFRYIFFLISFLAVQVIFICVYITNCLQIVGYRNTKKFRYLLVSL